MGMISPLRSMMPRTISDASGAGVIPGSQKISRTRDVGRAYRLPCSVKVI